MCKTGVIRMRNAIHEAGRSLSASGNSFTTSEVQAAVEKSMHVIPGDQFTESVLGEEFQIVNVIESRWISPPIPKSVQS